MKTTFVKLLLAITVSAMVTLAVMGTYIIGEKSRENPIVLPIMKKQPKKVLPEKTPPKRFIRPGDYNPDAPNPR